MKLLVVGYWLWFGVSIIVLSRRLILRVTRGPARGPEDAPSTGDTPTTATPVTSLDDVATRVAARLAGAVPATAAADETVDADDADEAVEAGEAMPAAATSAIVTSSLDTVDAVDAVDAVGTAEDEASVVPSPGLPQPTRSPVAGARTTLAEVLRGITMPADLAPLVHVAGTDPTRRAVFCTTGRPVELVGVAVGEELARLGFTIEPVSATDSIARRGDDAVAVRMRAIGPQPPKGPADPAYPTAPAGSVVLDVELG